MVSSLELQQSVLGAVNSGQSTLVSAEVAGQPLVIAACGESIHVLRDVDNLLHSLPFELAFPIHSALVPDIQAVAFDHSTARIAAASAGRIAIWHLSSGTWRVHSSFKVSHSTTELHYSHNHIVVAGDTLTLWKLDESTPLPRWNRLATDTESSPILTARLSPSASVLACVKQHSSLVRICAVSSKGQTQDETPALRHLSYASHSVRIRSLCWRNTDSANDSGPVLYTQTIDGVFRIWGCEIDEPDFFSLWITLDPYSDLSTSPPLATCFLRRRPKANVPDLKEGSNNAIEDFVTAFADGSVYLTSVSNFDRRPPTCLKQRSRLIQNRAFRHEQLANLRHAVLLSSAEDTPVLIGRGSRGTLVRLQLELASSVGDKPASAPRAASSVTVSQLGTVRRLLPSGRGDSVLALGANGRIQNWEVDEAGVPFDNYVSDPSIKPSTKIASWHDGRMIVTAGPAGLKIYSFRPDGRMCLVAHDEDSLPPLYGVFVSRASDEALSITITALTSNFSLFTWTYSAATKSIENGSQQSLNESRSPGVPLVWAHPVPVVPDQRDIDEIVLCAIDAEGQLTFWSCDIPSSVYRWKEGTTIDTGRKGVTRAVSSAARLTAIISGSEDGLELSIWDTRASEFASGQQHVQCLSDVPVDLSWSKDGVSLAVAFANRVELLCAQRLDDLSGQPAWAIVIALQLPLWTVEPVSSICWMSASIAVASAGNIFFYSSRTDSGQDIRALVAEMTAPLPQHHPQLLYQALLQGHTELVTRILETIAAQLTDAGDVTPIRNSRANDQITVEDFVEAQKRRPQTSRGEEADLYTNLTGPIRRQESAPFGEVQAQRLLLALKQRPLRGLSAMEHDHLAVMVQAVFEVQHQRSALDSNGLRYLISMHTFRIYNTPTEEGTSLSTASRLKYRDVVWAFHSESQDLLLQESVKTCRAQVMTWADSKALGVFLWLRSLETVRRHMEAVGRSEFIRPGVDDRDPISATVFYLALRKKHIVLTFWKQSSGHADQRSMLKFMSNDFAEPRWKSAALKNAFALMSKRRFLFAVAFFLLGDSLKDAVNVCLRQLDDFQLAIAICRAYDGDSSPVLKTVLEDHVLPLAFSNGFRWLASWTFWMLDRRDLAIQVVITPMATLAAQLPYKLDKIGSLTHEDPSLIVLFLQLRSKSLQTVKGAVSIPGSVEFNFVLHMARVLCRMGCHVLALSLVSTYEFSQSEQPRSLEKTTGIYPRRRMGLRRMSTVMDMEVPSAINSRAPSPSPGPDPGQPQAPATNGFNQMLKKVKVETKAPAEFSFDAFDF